ncbi:MAG: hypothetical protein ACNA8W_17270 [Bradymonadaceae bacterium]
MSWSWHIYAPRTLSELDEIVDAYEEALATHIEDKVFDEDSELGMVLPGGPVPSPEDVAEARAKFADKVPDEVLERLSMCTGALLIENPGIPEVDPLQASSLRFLLELTSPGIVDWGDFDMELSEDVLARLVELPDAEPLGGESVSAEIPLAPGVKGAMDILEDLERIGRVQELRIDFERAVRRLPEMAQHYLALLYTQGVQSDEGAAQKLELDIEDIEDFRGQILKLMKKVG